MTALDKLIAAVEAGAEDQLYAALRAKASAARDRGKYWPAHDAIKAFDGSLDAARRLHEALLHERCVMSLTYSVRYEAKACITDPINNAVWESGTEWLPPARAWLLAILRALKAQGEKA